MGLSCDCDIDEGDRWYITQGDIDFETLKTRKRKRCASCNKLISIGADCLSFARYRCPTSEIEENIYGDEVPLADKYLCESCGEIFLNLHAIGYCYMLGDDLRENLQDYWEMTGFNPNQYR